MTNAILGPAAPAANLQPAQSFNAAGRKKKSPASGQGEFQVAELLDRGHELVAGLQPHLLLLLLAGDDALGRAGEDEVARPEREVARDVTHELPRVEHHVGGARRLHDLAVDATSDLEIVAVDL